jgi:rsbT co-antagonist protein RsbR
MKMEEITKEDIDRMMKLFKFSIDILCVASLDGYIRFTNPAFEKITGYAMKELLERPFLDYVHPDDRAATVGELRKLSSGVPTVFFDNRYLCKDGSIKWIRWNAYPAPSEGVTYAVGREITRMKKTEEEIGNHSRDLEKTIRTQNKVLQEQVHELKERDELLTRLSTPLAEVAEGIVLLPVVGVLDSSRAKQLTESVLGHLARGKTDVVVLDVSGISAIDTRTSSYILRTVQAVRLMGSEMILTGIRPDVSTTLVTLDIDLKGVVTRSTLREGLEYAFEKLGLKLTKVH